jgi:hypothetical protein
MTKLFGLAVLVAMLAIAPAHAVTVYYQPTPYPTNITTGIHSWSGWFNNSYNQTLVQDDKLQIGGWGDTYVSPIRFDLKGLPPSATGAYLYLYAIPSGAAGPSQVFMFPITSDSGTRSRRRPACVSEQEAPMSATTFGIPAWVSHQTPVKLSTTTSWDGLSTRNPL